MSTSHPLQRKLYPMYGKLKIIHLAYFSTKNASRTIVVSLVALQLMLFLREYNIEICFSWLSYSVVWTYIRNSQYNCTAVLPGRNFSVKKYHLLCRICCSRPTIINGVSYRSRGPAKRWQLIVTMIWFERFTDFIHACTKYIYCSVLCSSFESIPFSRFVL